MNYLNKTIRLKYGEIIFEIIVFSFLIIIGKIFSNSELVTLLNTSIPESLAYVDVIKENNLVYPIKDEEAIQSMTPSKINLVNDTYSDTIYELGIRINKKSSLDYKYLKIYFKEKVSLLKDLYIGEDDNYYYFLLETGNIKATTLNYEIKIWLKDTSENDIQNKSLFYEFVNLKNLNYNI